MPVDAMAGGRAREPRATRHFWQRHERTLVPALLLAPGGLLFAVFVLYPIAASVGLSFYEWNGVDPKAWVGLDNFRELLADRVFYTALANNLIWLALIVAAPLLGLAAALLLDRATIAMRLARSLFFLPFVISQVVVGMIFAWFFNADFGLLNAMLTALGTAPTAPLENEHGAIFAVILAGLWPQTAYCMMLYLAGLTAINRASVEAARLDGAHGWRLIWHIVVPQLWSAHFIVALVCVVGALRSFDLVMIMTRGGPDDSSTVLGLYMYEQAFLSLRYGYAATIASVQFALMSACVAFFLWHMLRRERR
jgi:multiple sugar transport system permease protein